MAAPPLRMNREEWRRWSQDQGARSERVRGEVVAMAPERWAHARAKANILLAFRTALAEAGNSDCVAVPDGMTVEIDDDTDYEPDVAIHCGGPIPDDSIAIPRPVVVVEVLSPTTRHVDTHIKLGDYFRVPSIQHYLLVRADRREVMHYSRDATGSPALATVRSGTVTLDPPGIGLRIEEIYS